MQAVNESELFRSVPVVWLQPPWRTGLRGRGLILWVLGVWLRYTAFLAHLVISVA